jgi:hypothetical protein
MIFLDRDARFPEVAPTILSESLTIFVKPVPLEIV